MAFGFDSNIILSGKYADPERSARTLSDLITAGQTRQLKAAEVQRAQTLADIIRGQAAQFSDPLAQKLAEHGMPEQAMEWEQKVKTQQARPAGMMVIPGADGRYYRISTRDPEAPAQPINTAEGTPLAKPKPAPRPAKAPMTPLEEEALRLKNERTRAMLEDRGTKAASAAQKGEKELRQEIAKDARLVKYRKSAAELGNLRALANVDSGAGDMAIVFAFMKALDPESAVREGEYANAAATGAPTERMKALVSKYWSGEKLTPEQRALFIEAAEKAQEGHKAAADEALGTYKHVAKKYGHDFKALGLKDDPPPKSTKPGKTSSAADDLAAAKKRLAELEAEGY